MKNVASPLNNIRIASPCSANWNEMYGDNRKRFCGQCQLNVYNLSGMSKNEAESLLLNSEGSLCVRYYRRNDGTILTKDCPVGWQAIKRRVSGLAAAAFSMIIGIFGGIFAFSYSTTRSSQLMGEVEIKRTTDVDSRDLTVNQKSDGAYVMGTNSVQPVTAGTPTNLEDVRNQLRKNKK